MFSPVIPILSKVGLRPYSAPTVDCEMVHIIKGNRHTPVLKVKSLFSWLLFLLPHLAEPQH
ncbi:hypothetical protein I79_012921 [Cricetulus griseus]|uniref:Uncharacterized protein n=1 Tax=Cricetulus griseus TaxID=10029 RepID=G3HQ30_CRIGR|nr:hypothetical protein I79_012921 [Cricetulus griseus]